MALKVLLVKPAPSVPKAQRVLRDLPVLKVLPVLQVLLDPRVQRAKQVL